MCSQDLRSLIVPHLDCPIERSLAFLVPGVRICPSFEEELKRGQETILGRPTQGCPALAVSHIDISTVIQEDSHRINKVLSLIHI